MDSISLKALAKINIGLDVTGIRDDGYHEVRMIMQTVNLFDKLTIKKSSDDKITMSTNLKFLPVDGDNLCIKAARLLIEEFGIKEGVHIDLEKHIPVAAGMAGGSTDAAAVLFGVNKLFNLKLSQKDLMERGVKIGADVPYCIMRGTALAEGIGEVLSPLPPMIKCPVLIAKPGISVSTKQVYTALDSCFDTVEHPDIDGIIIVCLEPWIPYCRELMEKLHINPENLKFYGVSKAGMKAKGQKKRPGGYLLSRIAAVPSA